MNATSSTIVQRLWNYCNVLRDEWWLESARVVESAVDVGLERAARLRHIVPEGEAVLRSAFEGRLG